MCIREIIKELNAPYTMLFKPGYPTGRGVYMCRTRDRDAMYAWLPYYGLEASRVNCGHDYNYDGDLYKITLKGN